MAAVGTAIAPVIHFALLCNSREARNFLSLLSLRSAQTVARLSAKQTACLDPRGKQRCKNHPQENLSLLHQR